VALNKKKLELEEVKENLNYQTYIFVSYLRPDFVDCILRITVNKENRVIEQLYFSSSSYGTASWINGSGVVEAHGWETEDSAAEVSYLSKHYPALLLNGEVSRDCAYSVIIPDVLSHLFNGKLAEILQNTVKEKTKSSAVFDPEDYNIDTV